MVRLIFCFVCLVMVSTATFGQSTGRIIDKLMLETKWPASDSPYLSIKKSISLIGKDKTKLESIIFRLNRKAKDSKVTHLEAYEWCQALFMRVKGDYEFASKVYNRNDSRYVIERLESMSLPGSFEFSKTILVLFVNYDFPWSLLLPTAERMLKQAPKDLDLLSVAIRLCSPPRRKEDRAKGEAFIRRMEALEPDPIKLYASKAGFFYRCWIATGTKSDADRAIAELQKQRKTTSSPTLIANIDRIIMKIRNGIR